MGDVWSVERVARYLCALWGSGTYQSGADARMPEARMLCLDCTKANVELGWWPRYKVARALETTVAWYRAWQENPAPERMRAVTLRQIRDYVDAAPYGRDELK
jgi:CDP-glucose 4,6-dehydratase